jgi:hypothetical protein
MQSTINSIKIQKVRNKIQMMAQNVHQVSNQRIRASMKGKVNKLSMKIVILINLHVTLNILTKAKKV